MFGGKFSHTKYSLRGEADKDIPIQAFFAENVNAMIAVGNNIQGEAAFREAVHAEAQLTYGIEIRESYSEKVYAKSSLSDNCDMGTAFLRETVEQSASIGGNILEETEYGESVGGKAVVGFNYEISERYAENICTDINAGINIPVGAENYREAVFAAVSAAIPEADSFTIRVSVPPNSEVRIDSQNFTVTLDGEPILHLCDDDGEFVNLTRETLSLLVSNGSEGSIEGKLMYTERYL